MRSRSGVVALVSLAAGAGILAAQPSVPRALPFIGVAATGGAVGFTDAGAAQSLLGGYGYAALYRLILGVQGGSMASAAPDVIYGMATLGYPARAIRQSLAYPFVGVGYGVVHAFGPRSRSALYGAGVGADRIVDPDGFGLLVGFRGGYLFRPSDVGERALYFNLALGFGGKRVPEETKPPVIIAQRDPGAGQER